MISIRSFERRDIDLGLDGNLAFVEGLDAVAQNCETSMSAQRGEMVFAADEGIPTLSTVWDKYRPALFEAAARRALLAVEGVTEVVEFRQSASGGVLAYSAAIKTIYGPAAITATLP